MSSVTSVAGDGVPGPLRDAIAKHRAEPLAPILSARGLGPYRGYGELLGALGRLPQRGARLRVIGKSVRGEPLVAVELGAASNGSSARTSVIVAGLHPIEWIGIETAMALLDRLVGADLGTRTLIVLPLSNPDGMLRVEKNLRGGKRRFVRHNARGVDLNRNFDARWGHKSLLARLVPWVFKSGSHAASEPEVAAIAGALGRRRVDRALSLHSFGGVVLTPCAHSLRPPADADDHRRWARRIADAADDRPYWVLPSVWFGFGQEMGGLELDWFHERHGAISLLCECSRGGLGLRPSRLFEPFAWFNPPKPHEVAGRIAEAAVPFVRGDGL
jgi:zinc carboxypeptidase